MSEEGRVSEHSAANEGGGPPQAGRPLTRVEVESILTDLGAWKDGNQTRPLTREDVSRLMMANAASLGCAQPTGERLPLHVLAFIENLDLSDSNFQAADFGETKLEGAAFRRAILRSATFHRANLQGAVFLEATLQDANFTKASLPSAAFLKANLQNAKFGEANLTNARLNEAKLQRSDFFRADLRGADFSVADLQRSRLHEASLQNAILQDASLQNADLRDANLQNTFLLRANLQEAVLWGTNCQGAVFRNADLRNADLRGANLAQCRFFGAKLDTLLLEGITWSTDHKVPEELANKFEDAETIYRSLKRAHQNAGIYDIADQFAYREQVVRKKQAFTEKRWATWASLQFAELLFGYGYRWKRVVVSSATALITFWLLYWLTGLGTPVGGPPPVLNALYFSTVSFTAVGYGSWVATGQELGGVKYFGAFEAIVGVFLMALFLVTFTRHYLR